MGKGVFFIIALILISIPFICASLFGYDNPNLPHLKKIEEYISKTGDSATGTFNFNGGWMNNGLSIIGGKIYAQIGYFYNITSLNVTKQNLTIIENLDVGRNVTASNFLGNINASYVQNNPWIEDSQEGNLNVNRSNFWNNYNIPDDIVYSDLYTNFWDANVDLGSYNFTTNEINATGDIYSNNYQVLSYQRTVNVKNVTMTAVI